MRRPRSSMLPAGTGRFQWPVNGRGQCDERRADVLRSLPRSFNGLLTAGGNATVAVALVRDGRLVFQWPVNGRGQCDSRLVSPRLSLEVLVALQT